MRRFLELLSPLLRLALSLALLAWLLPGWSGLRAHLALQALPVFDGVAPARALAAEQRYPEALVMLDAMPDSVSGQRLRADIEAARADWRYRAREVMRGAWRGEGDTTEALSGAVVADLLVFGDVRDLVIQGDRALRGAPTDPVIIALSGLGLALTATPAADLGAATLKLARRTGALSARFLGQLRQLAEAALRRGDGTALRSTVQQVGHLAEVAEPAIALRLLRSARGVEDLPQLRRWASDPAARYALWVGGAPVLDLGRRYGDEALPVLREGAHRGPAGLDFVIAAAPRLLRPHPGLGLVKGLYKGHLPRLVARAWPQLMLALYGALAALAVQSAVTLWWRGRRSFDRPKKTGAEGPR